jgi:hypothetical protein
MTTRLASPRGRTYYGATKTDVDALVDVVRETGVRLAAA